MKPSQWISVCLIACCICTAAAQSKPAKKYDLSYRLKKGEVVRMSVEHQVKMRTTIDGVAEEARTHSESVKRFNVTGVDKDGNMTLVYSIEKVKMWQHVQDKKQVTYDSEKDKNPDPRYARVAASIGQPLGTLVITPNGVIRERKQAQEQFNPGIGELVAPMPGKPVSVGQRWYVPTQLRLRLPDKKIKVVKTRQVYTLKKVEVESGDEVATIEVKTEVLTPVNEPSIKAELVQRLQFGTIRFDLATGRVRTKRVDMNESVPGFRGENSRMEYNAAMTEIILR